MKILITESQYKLIKEQNENPSLQIIEKEVVYTSKTEYNYAKLVSDVLKLLFEDEIYELKIMPDVPSKANLLRFIQDKNTFSNIIDKKIENLIKSKSPNFIKKLGKKIVKQIEDNYKKQYYILYSLRNKGKGIKKIFSEKSKYNQEFNRINNLINTNIGDFIQGHWVYIGPYTVEKPIFKDTSIKPIPTITTTQQVDNKQTTDTKIRTNPITNFSVSWREDTPSGEVFQNTHYFPNYNEWKEFVTQYPHFSSKNENGSKTEAQALYSGLHADISKDKTFKGPQ
jgi:hypothetical protein